jgi:KDO2-lipid IV(A) lauroyltransferase
MKNRDLSKPWVTVLFWTIWHSIRLLPLPVASAVLSTFMEVFSARVTRQSAIVDNLSKAFPEMPAQKVYKIARKASGHLGVVAAELCHIERFLGGSAKGIFTYDGSHQLELAKKGPVIFVGPHQGNWELVPILGTEHGIKITSIYARFGNALIDRTIFAQRQKTGASYVEKRRAVRALMKALESGESLAFLMDQRVRSGVRVKFFGRDTPMTPVPARLAIRYQCPIVPADIEKRRDGTYHVTFHSPIYPPAQGGWEAEREMTQLAATQLEQTIRRAPETWFCNKRRWPDGK